MTIVQDKLVTLACHDEDGDYVPNVLSPGDVAFRPKLRT